MAVTALPAAPSLPAVARLRETTTLLTLDDTLLHRDRITLRPGAIGTALDLTLPSSAALWSARVDEVPVRPLERGNGTISVPLGFDTGRDAVVEVISVQEKAIPTGRSELVLDLPRVALPVQEHRWRLLLPDGASYRYRSGELRPALVRRPAHQAISTGANADQAVWSVDGLTDQQVAEMITVNETQTNRGATVSQGELEKIPTARVYHDFDTFEEMQISLRQSLVGGVKPLPITIPETGKLLLLTGVLPLEKIGVELEVKGKK